MRILKKFVLIMVLTFSFTNVIKSECDDKTISNLKLQASNIEINYEHVDDLYSEDFDLKIVNTFNIYISGINDQMYINDVSEEQLYLYDEAVSELMKIENVLGGSSLKFEIYSKECEEKLKTISIKVPYFNSYSESDLCLQYSDAAPCNKFLDYEMTQEKFDSEIAKYINKDDKKDMTENLLTKIIDFIKDNYIYILIAIIIIATFITIIVINKRRGELN